MSYKIVLFLLNLLTISKLKKINSDKNKTLFGIKKALQETLKNNYFTSEILLIEKIENIRAEMLASSLEIDVIDFGAGSSDVSLTKDEMERGIRKTKLVCDAAKVSKNRFWASFLFKLVRELKPKNIIELGTNVGISSSYMGSAQLLNKTGYVKTLEGANSLVQIANKNFQSLNLKNVKIIEGRFLNNLPLILDKEELVDFVFIDGHHDEFATFEYFHIIKPFLHNNSLVIFDDISWSKGMRRAWNKIKLDEKKSYSIDLGTLGLFIFGDMENEDYRIRMPFV